MIIYLELEILFDLEIIGEEFESRFAFSIFSSQASFLCLAVSGDSCLSDFAVFCPCGLPVGTLLLILARPS